jgi:hypothetical protein
MVQALAQPSWSRLSKAGKIKPQMAKTIPLKTIVKVF